MINKEELKQYAIWGTVGFGIGCFCQFLNKGLGYSMPVTISIFAILYGGAMAIAFIQGYYKGSKDNDPK